MRKAVLYLPLILLGLTLYFSYQAKAAILARQTPHAPDWGAAKRISDTNAPNLAERPFIDASPNGDKLIIVYNRQMSSTNFDTDPYFSRSTNDGQTWTSPAPIHTSLGVANKSVQVNLEIDANDVGHAVWVEKINIIYYSKEPNWGNDNPVEIHTANIGVGGTVANPQIVASGNNTLDIIWTVQENSLPQIWHARSTNGGASWSNGVQITNGIQAFFPHIVVDETNNLHIVWEDTDPADLQITHIGYMKGTSSGNSVNWSNAIKIADVTNDDPTTSKIARRPKILTDGNHLHVAFTAYHDDETQWIHYVSCTRNCTNAQNWPTSENISINTLGVNSNAPKYLVSDIALSRNCVYVYFHGIDDVQANNEIVLGTNKCDAWSGRDNQITNPQAQSLHASLALTPGWIHLVYDERAGGTSGTTRQIYYLRGEAPPYTLALPFIAR